MGDCERMIRWEWKEGFRNEGMGREVVVGSLETLCEGRNEIVGGTEGHMKRSEWERK